MTAATPTPGPTQSVVVTSNVDYESSNSVLTPGVLSVYAPTDGGPWPVVVMFHAPGWTTDLSSHARQVAGLGFVVFMPTWGIVGSDALPTYDQALALGSQAACAVAFAGAHAADYGGDPRTMVVFGHSGGAQLAATVAFGRPQPSPGCLAGAALGVINALVTWEGDWLLCRADAGWDPLLAADPRLLDALTPWNYLAEQPDLKVVMLVSEHPGVDIGRSATDLAWLGARDPTGDLRRQLEANGAFADGIFDVMDLQQLLFSVLEAQGNPVSLDVMPESDHEYVRGAGWPVFLDAFEKAAGRE